MSRRGRLGEPLDPGGDAEQDLVVRLAEGDLDAGVAEEVDEVAPLGRLGRDRERPGDAPLHPGHVGRHQPQDVPAGHRRMVVLVGDGQADVVDHAQRR